jgi:hypothetical protein
LRKSFRGLAISSLLFEKKNFLKKKKFIQTVEEFILMKSNNNFSRFLFSSTSIYQEHRAYAIGIESFGRINKNPKTVYTQVSKYIKWIEDTIKSFEWLFQLNLI